MVQCSAISEEYTVSILRTTELVQVSVEVIWKGSVAVIGQTPTQVYINDIILLPYHFGVYL